MDAPTPQPAPRPRRALVVVIVGLVIAVALIGVGVCGLIRGPVTTQASQPETTGGAGPSVTAPATVGALPSPIPATSDPEEFARRVAVAVFTWDTANAYGASDYIQQVVDVGDPSGTETPGLAADAAAYLPNTAAWARLRPHQTRQWLTIDTAVVPSSWARALQQGQATLLPGTTAYTITGTRHRAGVWDGKPVTTAGRVSFTVFEICKPTYPTCRLLRLSQLDNPLP